MKLTPIKTLGRAGWRLGLDTYVQAGVSEVLDIPESIAPMLTLAIIPDAGVSARAEITLASDETIQAGQAPWLPWALGDVSTPSLDTFAGVIASVRFVSTGRARVQVLAKIAPE